MACGPVQCLILPDPLLCGPANVESVTSEQGPCPPEVIPDPDNCGNMVLTVLNPPEDPGVDPIEFLTRESGAVGVGGIVYRDTGLWTGQDDVKVIQKWNAPFASGVQPYGNNATYCRNEKVVMVAAIDTGTEEIVLQSRSVYDAYDDWTETRVDPSALFLAAPPIDGSVDYQRVALEYTESGLLLCAYMYFTGDSSPFDTYGIALLKSEDCGATWSLVNPDITDGGLFRPDLAFRWAVSGSWIRLCYIDLLPSGPVAPITRASRDNGLTWSDRVENPTILVDLGGVDEDPSPYDVIGLGGGLFLFVKLTTAVTGADFNLASGFAGEAWVGINGPLASDIRTMPAQITGFGGVVAWGKVWLTVAYSDGAGSNVDDQMQLLWHSLEGLFEQGPGSAFSPDPIPSEWQPVDLSAFFGLRHQPVWLNLVNVDERELLLVGGAWDEVDVDQDDGGFVCQLSGHSFNSMGSEPINNQSAATAASIQTADPLFDLMWGAPNGPPAGPGASPDTSWTNPTGGVFVVSPTKDLINISTTVGNATYFLDRTAATPGWADEGSILSTFFRINSGSSIAAFSHGVRVIAAISGTDEFEWQLRADTTSVRLFDVKAGVTRATLALDMTKFSEVRVGFLDGGAAVATPGRGFISAYNVDDPEGTLVGAVFLLTRAVVGPAESVQFGGFIGSTGDSDWREIKMLRNRAAFSREYSFWLLGGTLPDFWLGVPAQSFPPVLVSNCHRVSAGGGSSALEDSWTTEPCHLYPAEAALQQSCQVRWRSSTPWASGQEITFVADPDRPWVKFKHQAIALCGVEQFNMSVLYSDDPAFIIGVGIATISTLSPWGIGAFLEIDSVDGDWLTYVEPVNARKPIPGELIGMRLATFDDLTKAYCILDHCDNRIRLGGVHLTTDLATLGFTPGSDLITWRTSGFEDYGTTLTGRYMRITFNNTVEPCTGYDSLGAVVAGCKVDVPIPLEWTHTDDDQSNVQVFEGDGGIQWAYQRGPGRRVWVGRVINDYIRWRESMRYLLDALSAYETRPLAFIPDVENQGSLIYGRWLGGSNLANSFWWNQDDGDGEYQFPGGDLEIRIAEVP